MSRRPRLTPVTRTNDGVDVVERRRGPVQGRSGSRLNRQSLLGVPLLTAILCVGCGDENAGSLEPSATRVTINELQSRNSSIESDTGKKSDWVELHNPSDAEENLEGYFVSDDLEAKQKGQLGVDAIVPPGGYLVLWLDDTENASTPLHFPFKLSGDGDYFLLSDPTGRVVASVTIPPDPTGEDTTAPDVSFGAYPDGSDAFNWCRTPTPARPNAVDCAPPDAAD